MKIEEDESLELFITLRWLVVRSPIIKTHQSYLSDVGEANSSISTSDYALPHIEGGSEYFNRKKK